MKAFVVERYQKKGELKLVDISQPQPKEFEILVEIKSTAVNVLDSKIRDGEFKVLLPYKTPFILGHDLAGVVKSIGSGVTKFKVGDEVYSRPRDHHQGTYAEYITVHENDLSLKPKNISMNEAASIPLVGLTAWQALVEMANLKVGQKVFIQAGSGGVGTFAIQLAKHLGAYVATTTSAKNISLVKSLGADEVIDYQSQDFEKILTNYDLVLNSQDAKTLEKSLSILKPGGLLISISGPPDPAYAKSAGLNFLLKLVMAFLSAKVRKTAKRLGVRYSFLFMRADGKQLDQITKLIEAGKIKPVIDKVFPFNSTKDALVYVESGRSAGKVVIQI
jgi:NADPH:quinone reductase-like Zn-dependent oxidoreductase